MSEQDRAKLVELYRLEREAFQRQARQDLCYFTKYTYPEYKVAWFHRLLCQKLNDFADRKIKRLMVFLPPRHGKSELVSRRLPAYILGKYPDSQIISASYSDSLAKLMNRDVQRIIDSDLYAEVFPYTTLNADNVRTDRRGGYLRNSDIFEIVNHKGQYRSCGIGGGITGMGADYAIIDDPIKNSKEADSLVFRNSIDEWYKSTLYTRLEKDGCVLVTLTRWHEDDLAGRLIERIEQDDSDDEKWEVLSFPAVCESTDNPEEQREIGQALWEYKYPLNKLEKIKKSLGSRFWNALYQQRPAPDEGGKFKKIWFKFYDKLPDLKSGVVRQSWDMNLAETKEGSYCCGQVWLQVGANHYLIEQYRARVEFVEATRALQYFKEKYPMTREIYIENRANGYAAISVLKNKIAGLVAVEPDGSKEVRADAVTHIFEGGNVYVPNPNSNRWVDDYISELCVFPNGANDDQVDTTTQYLNKVERGFTGIGSVGSITKVSVVRGM